MLETLLLPYVDAIAAEFSEHFQTSYGQFSSEVYAQYGQSIRVLLHAIAQDDRRGLQEQCRFLAQLNYSQNLPYAVMLNELRDIKERLMALVLEHQAAEVLYPLQQTYNRLENMLAREHMHQYMNGLRHSNNIRISSLKDIINPNLIKYYEGHLEWLNGLMDAIAQADVEAVPQLDATLCVFGKWLAAEGKSVISNNSKYEYVISIHKTLHGLARAIKNLLQKESINYSVVMSYLEKSELISLMIGTELALIDNKMLVKESSRDEMTGALNRNALDHIFMNQYELAIATDSSFVLAMCDLDHFKMINDTHGHLVGDKVLREFVSLCKHRLRESDVIVRYGGEEFIIIMPNTSLIHGVEKLEALRRDFANLCCVEGDTFVSVSVSIGAIRIDGEASHKQPKQALQVFLEQADRLLYEAKHSGRNRVVYRS